MGPGQKKNLEMFLVMQKESYLSNHEILQTQRYKASERGGEKKVYVLAFASVYTISFQQLDKTKKITLPNILHINQ